VGSGVRVADQALAQAAVEFGRGADFAIDGKDDSARTAFWRCAERAKQATALAEDVPQVLRTTVLRSRCLAVLPDRAAAAGALAKAAKGMEDRSDAAEFWYGAGRLQEDMGRLDSAYSLYKLSWKADPKGAFASQALHSEGLVLADAGRFSEILPLCEAVEKEFASDPRMRVKARILEGRAWLGLGDTARALFRWKTLTNSFVKGVGELMPDSVEAAEVYWRLGDLSARRAAQIRFDATDVEGRKAAHSIRRDLMEESFGYFRQAVACYAYPWTPAALRDIAGVIERYAVDVAGQKIDFRNDTDRVAQEILVQRKLPSLFQSAGTTYRRQIRLARTSGDGIGIGLQSGHGLARSWWSAVQARRTAADLLRSSPRPPADSLGLAWYNHVVDSAVTVELSTGRRTASEGLADLAQWGQLGWTESDSIKVFLGPEDAAKAVARGLQKGEVAATGVTRLEPSSLTAIQWSWRALEARRQSRNTLLDIRLLKARLSGQ
jgi:tetratricopeptide (TPR) repeat protein